MDPHVACFEESTLTNEPTGKKWTLDHVCRTLTLTLALTLTLIRCLSVHVLVFVHVLRGSVFDEDRTIRLSLLTGPNPKAVGNRWGMATSCAGCSEHYAAPQSLLLR